jgi:type I restriction enzyme R subunit
LQISFRHGTDHFQSTGNELVPFPERVTANFTRWLAQQENTGKKFTDEQRQWLEMIRDHIAANLSIEANNFDYAPFAQKGGIGKTYRVFDENLNKILDKMNEMLAA